MNKFQQIIEDQYAKLGIKEATNDSMKKDQEQANELEDAKQETSELKDKAHDAKLTAQKSQQDLSTAEQEAASDTTDSNTEKSETLKKRQQAKGE